MVTFPERLDNISYLKGGTDQQRKAYYAITNLNLLGVLKPFSPVLCGTIPLAIDVPGSDLDIICEATDLAAFEQTVSSAFSHSPGYTIRLKEKNGFPTCICNFSADGFPIEIFGQPRPVTENNAYRHMVIEAHLLTMAGPKAAEEIRGLKAQGIKTEPAFAIYFGLDGDPYETLLNLSNASDRELLALVRRTK